MPEIPRAYASPNVPAIAFQAPEFHAQRELARAVQEYGALEERQQLQSYGIEVQTAINNGIIEARTAAAATTDPDQYQQIYQDTLDKTFQALEPTTGGDTRRQLVLGGTYATAVRRESDNIAAGVIHRRLQLAQVNAQRAADTTAKQMADTQNPAEVQAARDEYNLQLSQTPFLDLGAQEALRNKQLELYGHNLIDTNQLERLFKEESTFAKDLPEPAYRKLIDRADSALTRGIGLSQNLKKATQKSILNEFYYQIENGKDPTEVWKTIEPRLAEEKVLDFDAKKAFNDAWSSFHSKNGPESEIGLRFKNEFQTEMANIPAGRSIAGLVQKYINRVDTSDDIDLESKAKIKGYFLDWRNRQDSIGRALQGQARVTKHEELQDAARQVRAYFNPPSKPDPRTGLPPVDLSTILGGETASQRASRMVDQMAAEGDRNNGDYAGAARRIIEDDKKMKAAKPKPTPPTDAEKEMLKRGKELIRK